MSDEQRKSVVSFGIGLLVMVPVALIANAVEAWNRTRSAHWVMGAPCGPDCWCRRW